MLDPFHDLKVPARSRPEHDLRLNGIGRKLNHSVPAALCGGSEPARSGVRTAEPTSYDARSGEGMARAFDRRQRLAAIAESCGDAADRAVAEFFHMLRRDISESAPETRFFLDRQRARNAQCFRRAVRPL